MALEGSYRKSLLVASLFIILLRFATAEARPRSVDFSSKTYGPDGPWHALNVSIGSPPQFVDLFPGHLQTSFPLAKHNCVHGASCPGSRGGFYDASKSSSKTPVSQNVISKIRVHNFEQGYGFFSPAHYNGTVDPVEDTIRVYSKGREISAQQVGIEALSNSYTSIINTGYSYPLTLGFFSLGASFGFDTLFGTKYPKKVLYRSLYEQGKIPSPSFTIHIGSPSLKIPPSFVLGGYDSSRLIGRVLSQPIAPGLQFIVNIVDIGLDAELDTPPFVGGAHDGLLMLDNGTSTGVPAVSAFSDPYMYLPSSTCDAIARYLPVHFERKYGLYIWDTSNPLFKKIMSSSTFLYFSLQPNNPGQNLAHPIKIKVPFQALRLTLEPPLSPKSKLYFPCAPVAAEPFVLGRAFLQAATLGANWGTSQNNLKREFGNWYLAQAPGPNISEPELQAIEPGDVAIFSGMGSWKRSWQHFWEAAPTTSSSGSGSKGRGSGGGSMRRKGGGSAGMPRTGRGGGRPSRSQTTNAATLPENTVTENGLSSGAQAGIGVAVASFVLAVAAIIGFFTLRRRRPSAHVQEVKAASPRAPSPQQRSNAEVSYAYPPDFYPQGSPGAPQSISPHPSHHTSQGTTQTTTTGGVHELPAGETVLPVSPVRNTFTGDNSPIENATQMSATPPGTATFYSADAIVSPISPINPIARNAFARVASVTAGREQPPSYPSVRPQPPVEERAELEADRGAELEAPRAVEKSGFLVA